MMKRSILATTFLALTLSTAPAWAQSDPKTATDLLAASEADKPIEKTDGEAKKPEVETKTDKAAEDKPKAAAEAKTKVVEEPKEVEQAAEPKKAGEPAAAKPKVEEVKKAIEEKAAKPAEAPKAAETTEVKPAPKQGKTRPAQAEKPSEDLVKKAEKKKPEPVEKPQKKAVEKNSADQPKAETTADTAKSAPKDAETEAQPADAPNADTADKKPKPDAKPVDETAAAPQAERPSDDQAKSAAPAIVKDDLSETEKENLAQADRKRRKDKRERRRELLGAAAAGVAVGVLVKELGGKVVGDEGDRIIVERDGEIFVRKDENERLRDNGARVRDEVLPNGNMRTTVERPNGVQVVTLRDPGGFILRRTKQLPNGDIVVLVDNRDVQPGEYVDYGSTLPPINIGIPEDRYIVDTGSVDRTIIRETLSAKPVETTNRTYTLREVRDNERLRAKVRRIDLDTLTFDTGSYSLTRSQVNQLADIGNSMQAIIDENPREVFLIEGHTDAVGDGVSNLTLSDRRAETIARVLTQSFGVPPENMVVQGYGEQYLKVNSSGSERANRRVSVRRITPLLKAS